MRLAIAAAFAALTAWAQSAAYKAPRTSDGQPDLQGIWMARGTAHYDLEDHGAALGILGGLSVVVDPADGRIPYQPAALKIREENFKRRHTADPLEKCFQPGVPRAMYIPFPFQIFQTANFVIIASEFAHAMRTVHFKGEHPEELEFWMGDSRGKWEGDTLVIDVGSFNDQTWFDKSGNHHSTALRVVERIARTAPDVLTYEATITDPKTFTRPWTLRVAMDRQKDRKQLLEYECHVYLEEEKSK